MADDNDIRRQLFGITPYEPRESLPSPYLRYLDLEPKEEVHLRDYLSVIVKRKWIVLTFFSQS